MDFHNKTILITGGTGSFGQKCVQILLDEYHPNKLIIFSRDELKQSQMQQKFDHPSLRYFLGDIRDLDRLKTAFRGVDFVIHAAALKQVPAIEYNPFEAIKTNIIGGYNVIQAAIDCGVEKVIALSTDKAANPINLYGATKLCSDKLFISGNSMAVDLRPKFSVVRYGNVVGSRGSVVPLFLKQRNNKELTVTDDRMTRFFLPLEQGVRFVINAFDHMVGGEIFVPKIPSVKITDVAQVIAPDCQIKVTGIRPGEKLHECMVPQEDSRNTLEFPNYFVIQPQFPWWDKDYFLRINRGQAQVCTDSFEYRSDTNDQWLSKEEILQLATSVAQELGIEFSIPSTRKDQLHDKAVSTLQQATYR